MQSLIPPPFYFDPALYAEEQRAVFGTAWVFAGFTHDLRNPNDFVVAEVGGRSVAVQNFDGEVRAFANVCSHRFARIHLQESGNGALRCPYHGWIYNKEGVPYSIPARPRFDGLTREVVQGLGLKRYALDVCGSLVFVRESEEGPTLREFLGDAFDTVEAMTSALGERIDKNVVHFRSNWKVAVENTLEAYHVGFVHEQTFKKLGAKGIDFRWAGAHSGWMAPTDESTSQQMRKLASLYKTPYPVEGYYHQLVYPNVTVATLYGTSFGIQHFHPAGPGETVLTSHVFLPRLGEGVKLNAGMAEMMSRSTADFARQVFEEDKVVCEAVQLGLPETSQPGMLSDEEERVSRFQRAYMTAMGVELDVPEPRRWRERAAATAGATA